MSILQMSVSTSILILVIIVIRAVAINKLPKKTFLAFWAVALVRLLIPFSLPSQFSVYSLISNQTSVAAKIAGNPATGLFPITAPVQMQSEGIAALPVPAQAAPISWWTVLWIAGIVLFALYFSIAYVKCYMGFRASAEIQNDFVIAWLAEHKMTRPISIRQSSRISAPLTYGIFHPVILVPLNMDFSNERQSRYILAHEYTHIRRFDTVIKLLLTAALCVHWFNPLVWIMYILSNRDIELSCDETVVRTFGETIKSAYALALVSMEERKSTFTPYYNSFSKNAIEERIVAVMKIKKTSILAIGIAFILLAGVTTVFATSAMGRAANALTAIPGTAFTDEEYGKLLALRFDGYEKMTVAEYKEKVNAIMDADHPAYMQLIERMYFDTQLSEMRYTNQTSFFLNNLLMPITGEKWTRRDFSNYIKAPNKPGTEGGTLEYTITRTILDAGQLTVGQHEKAIHGIIDGLESFWKEKSDTELQNEAAMNLAIKAEIERLKKQWETPSMKLEIGYIYLPLRVFDIPNDNPSNVENADEKRDPPGSEADYQSLLALKTPGYQNLSVADFNSAVLDWANENFERSERIAIDVAFDDIQVSLTDEERAFVVLATRLSWVENSEMVRALRSGKPKADPAINFNMSEEQYPPGIYCSLWYQLTYHITDESKLTVGERARALGGVVNGISSFWTETGIEKLVTMSEDEVIAKLNKLAGEYSNDLIKISFYQVQFEGIDERAELNIG